MEDLKTQVDGEDLMGRIKYRKAVGLAPHKNVIMAKGQIFKQEHAQAINLADSDRHEDFGFKCLHYSVSEAVGILEIEILNKKKTACKVNVETQDGEAEAGKDYH